MSRRASRSEADAVRGLKAGRRSKPKVASVPTWSLPVVPVLKLIAFLAVVLVALDWLGWA